MIEWGNRALSISIWKGDWVLQIQGHLKEMSNKIILRQRTFHAINQLAETSPILFHFLPPFSKEIFREIFLGGNENRPYYLLSSCALFPPGVTNWCGWITFIWLQNSILLLSWRISCLKYDVIVHANPAKIMKPRWVQLIQNQSLDAQSLFLHLMVKIWDTIF